MSDPRIVFLTIYTSGWLVFTWSVFAWVEWRARKRRKEPSE